MSNNVENKLEVEVFKGQRATIVVPSNIVYAFLQDDNLFNTVVSELENLAKGSAKNYPFGKDMEIKTHQKNSVLFVGERVSTKDGQDYVAVYGVGSQQNEAEVKKAAMDVRTLHSNKLHEELLKYAAEDATARARS